MIITIANQKGGVGKTTTVVNLSTALASIDKKVLVKSKDEEKLLLLLRNHIKYTNSEQANRILSNWKDEIGKFKKVIPRDYAKILDQKEAKRKEKING